MAQRALARRGGTLDDQLMDAVVLLEKNPERFGRAPEDEWYQGNLRQLLHGKKRAAYRILFEIRGKAVFVLRVRHSAQNLLEPGEL